MRYPEFTVFNLILITILSCNLKGIVWHQGESDASKYDNYAAKIIALIKAFLVDFKMPDLPVIVGQLSEDKASRIAFK
jgi:hypothetical protein